MEVYAVKGPLIYLVVVLDMLSALFKRRGHLSKYRLTSLVMNIDIKLRRITVE